MKNYIRARTRVNHYSKLALQKTTQLTNLIRLAGRLFFIARFTSAVVPKKDISEHNQTQPQNQPVPQSQLLNKKILFSAEPRALKQLLDGISIYAQALANAQMFKTQITSSTATMLNRKAAKPFLNTLAITLVTGFVLFGGFGTIQAASMTDISRSFEAETKIESPGMLISLSDSGAAVAANQANSDKLIGVLVAKNSSAVEIDPSTSTVQVATSGKAQAIVSDIYGDIKKGDLLIVSTITGVAAKENAASAKVLGIAQQDFNSQSAAAKAQTITDNKGKSKSVNIGTIEVIVSIGGTRQTDKTTRHSGLFGWFEMLAGKPVSSVRLVLCAIISIISILMMFVMVYSATKSTIYGVSRNPLVKNTIFEAFAKVMFGVIVIAIVSVLIIYAILKV